MKIDFEQFLRAIHFKDNPQILDDELADEYDSWIADLDNEEIIKYGQQYAESINKLK